MSAECGVEHVVQPLTPDNYRQVLTSGPTAVSSGDFIVNLSTDVSSVDVMKVARDRGALYIDTVVEPWPGVYTNPDLTPAQRTNYALRESMLELRADPGGPTAVSCHGANPGLVSHFVKAGLMTLAYDILGDGWPLPPSREQWALLAQTMHVSTVHIAERDTQVSATRAKERGEFVNTWSIDGFVSEGCQPAELGWGTHEAALPVDGRLHDFGCRAGMYLLRPGASTRVRTWTPTEGPFHGFLITHDEALSISDYFTVPRPDDDGSNPLYRPTCHYAYHPCDDAVLSVHEFCGKNYQQQPRQRLMMEEITSGIDELGVLLAGHAKNALWYGSQLSIDEARAVAPFNNATSLQVCAAVLGGVVWAIENPDSGVVEPDEIDFLRVLEVAQPYLGPVVGVYTDWTPLTDRESLFAEDVDKSDPWQFKNVRVH